jgi:hypothetical protein
MANNTGFMVDPSDGEFDDWFELYNAGSSAVDLSGYYLSDNLTNLLQFRIPTGYVIPAGGFLLVWADEDSNLNATNVPHLHVNFRLNGAGEAIALSTPDGALLHAVTFEQQTANISQGFYPDATGVKCFLTSPSPAAPNTAPTNCTPIIDPIPTQYSYVGKNFRFTVPARDIDQPRQNLSFSLITGPQGASIHPVTGVINWLPSAARLGTNSFLARVSDNGYPPAAATANFIVIVITPPRITLALAGDGQVALSVPTVANKHYRIEFNEDLGTSNWQRLGDDITATGSTIIVQDTINSQQRFYRIEPLD